MNPSPGIAPEYRPTDKFANRERGPVGQNSRREEIPANMARQGVTGHNVRYVLLIGIAAVVIAFLIAFLFVVGRPG